MADRVLVIGASGISGGALIGELVDTGLEVWATARYRSRGGPWEAQANKVRFEFADVNDLPSLVAILRQSNPRHIYYLAAIVSVPFTNKVPVATCQTNVVGWVNLLEAVRIWGGSLDKLVWSGSGDQYGRSALTHNPLKEDAPFLPPTAYSASKCAQDLFAYQYFDQWKLPIIRARTFYLTGPGQVESYACASFAHQVARVESGRQQVIRHGNLDAARDYLDIRDIAVAYRLLAEKGCAGEAYNICSGRAVKMSFVLDTLRGLAKKPIPTETDPTRMRPSEIPTVVGCPDKLVAATGWKPARNMETTLREMLNYARACPS